MKKIWKSAAILFTMAMAVAMLIPGPAEVRAAGKTVSMKTRTVKVGKTVTLNVKKTSKKVKWSVNKSSIAKIVKTKGKKKNTAVVRGIRQGTAVVTAKAGKNKWRATIKVKATPPQVHVHSYTKPATCTEPAQCACGHTFGTPLGHQMAPATCQSPQKCIRCGETAGDPEYVFI